MVRAAVHVTLLLLSCYTADVRTQFFDFFPALQPIGPHTLRPLFPLDFTTRRPKAKTARRPQTTRSPFSFYSDDYERRTTRRVETTTKRTTPFSFYSEESERDKQKTKNVPTYDYYSTTSKPSRKTTKANPIRRHYNTNSDNSNSNVNKLGSKETSSGRNSQSSSNIENGGRNSQSGRNSGNDNSRNSNNKPKTVNNSRNVNVANIYNNNNDRLIFDDGKRNTVINYETTRPSFTTKSPYNYDTNKKNIYTTSNPLRTIRPGVKPLIVNGPPITNKPPTRKPSFVPRPEVNEDVSPELIIGPNEDFMSTVEKKRYIELAEKMCDKYKALDIEQIQAIPLVPSPDPVRVNVSTCTPNEAPLVVGGRVASIQEFRHMALLGWNKLQVGGYAWKCGGSLISNQYVLTAAHCAYQDRDNSVAVGPPQVVQLGSSYLDDPGAVVMKVAAVIRHPKYKLPKSYYDIALVKMKGTVSFSSVIKPACLGIPPAPGKPIIATGWGRTEFGGDQSEELRSVSLPIWDMTECYEVLGTSRRLPQGPSSDSQICAGEKKGGKDTCQGDSGGPAQIQDGCSWRVVAVTSVGRSCGAVHTPALYAKVPRAFVSAVVFAGQLSNNQQNNNQQSNNQGTNNQGTNSQQWNNNQGTNSQQWNNNQGTNSQQWNNNQGTNSQGAINQQWNNNQGTTTQRPSNPSQWNTNKPTNQWNNQQQNNQKPSNQPSNNQWNNQQSNNNQQNFNNNQQDSWYWNTNQGDPDKKPEYNNNNQNYQGSNNNVKRNDHNTQNYNNNQNNGYTTEKPVYNSQSGYYTEKPNYNLNSGNNNRYTTEKPNYNLNSGNNNRYTTENPVYNQNGGFNNRHTTEKPVYNQNGGFNNRYTTEKPVFNSQSGYYTEKPVYNQHGGFNNGYTADKPAYNNGYNNGYTPERPGYSQNGYYNDGVVNGYRPNRGYYNNDDNIWWT